MLKVTPFLLLLLFTSCYSAKKASKQTARAAAEYPGILAQYCDAKFPCSDSMFASDTVMRLDTQYITNPDVYLPCPPNGVDTVLIRATCPPSRVIINTVTIRDSFYVLDTRGTAAAVSREQTALQRAVVAEDRESRAKHTRNIWMWIAIGLGISWGIYWYIKIAKPL